eukprot:m.171450 g.171450  ORF g.171450 m.171450 type:complete len:378 (+) comp15285_c2_seq20:3257-4390(+)
MDPFYPVANPTEGTVMHRYVGDMAQRLAAAEAQIAALTADRVRKNEEIERLEARTDTEEKAIVMLEQQLNSGAFVRTELEAEHAREISRLKLELMEARLMLGQGSDAGALSYHESEQYIHDGASTVFAPAPREDPMLAESIARLQESLRNIEQKEDTLAQRQTARIEALSNEVQGLRSFLQSSMVSRHESTSKSIETGAHAYVPPARTRITRRRIHHGSHHAAHGAEAGYAQHAHSSYYHHHHGSLRHRIAPREWHSTYDTLAIQDRALPQPAGHFSTVYPVFVCETPSALRYGVVGDVCVRVSEQEIALIDARDHNSTLIAWDVHSIRRYGKDGYIVCFEIGRVDPNPGIFYIQTRMHEELFDAIERAIATSGNAQ